MSALEILLLAMNDICFIAIGYCLADLKHKRQLERDRALWKEKL